MSCLRGSGPTYFCGAMERTIREPDALELCYLSVVIEMAQNTIVDTASVRDLSWREIDEPTDLEEARGSFPSRLDRRARRPSAVVSSS